MSRNSDLRIGFVGASCINFGDPKLPWNHAARLESIGGLYFVGIADLDTVKAGQKLEERRAGPHRELYRNCKVYPSLEAMLEDAKPEAVILGTPPVCRGSIAPGKDAELTCAKAGVHLFVEKPLSVLPMDEFAKYVSAVCEAQEKSGTIVSVGYMFRYHAAVRKIKELILARKSPIRSISACYYPAYPALDRPFWWDVRESGGPIVEQATHMVDVSRFLGGEVVQSSIQGICQLASDPAAQLNHLPPGCDEGVPEKDRVPRVTMATWRFQSGGIGSLTHVVALPGKIYEAYMDILLDGMRIRWLDPYGSKSRLMIRGLTEDPDEEKSLHFGDCDMYAEELRTFVEAVRNHDARAVASTYSDAAKTYQLTRDIASSAKHS